MYKDAAALIVGFTIQGLAIARSLISAGIPVYVVEKQLKARSIFGRHPLSLIRNLTFLPYEDLVDDGLIKSLLDCRSKIGESKVVLYPASDNTVRTLARSWEMLDPHYRLSWSKCRNEVAQIIQKGALPEYCESAGILFPVTRVIGQSDDIDDAVSGLRYPVIVKPNKPASSFKTCLCDNQDDLISFVHTERDNWPLVVQEWVDGGDDSLFSYTTFLHHGDEVVSMASRKVRASPPGLGRATVVESVEDIGVESASKKLLEQLQVSGPIAMEFKKDSKGNYWFIEANVGRTEYCVDLAIQSGLDLPLLEFNQALNVPFPKLAGAVEPSIWYDTDKEPFCYLALCLKEKTLKPRGKNTIFPYWGRERASVLFAAFMRTFEEMVGRIIRKIRSILN